MHGSGRGVFAAYRQLGSLRLPVAEGVCQAQAGAAGKYPALIQGENYEEMTDLMVANSSFVKMKSLTLGYTFNLKPTRIRVFLSGENLFTIKDKTFDGFDPENGNSVGHYTNWGDDFPTPRILLIGTNLTF